MPTEHAQPSIGALAGASESDRMKEALKKAKERDVTPTPQALNRPAWWDGLDKPE